MHLDHASGQIGASVEPEQTGNRAVRGERSRSALPTNASVVGRADRRVMMMRYIDLALWWSRLRPLQSAPTGKPALICECDVQASAPPNIIHPTEFFLSRE